MENIPAEFLSDAIDDLTEILDELGRINAAGEIPLSPNFPQKLFRTLHTIKGSARTFGMDTEARIAHDIETFLNAIQENKVSWDAHSANLLTDSLRSLNNNFALVSQGKSSALPENLLAELIAPAGEAGGGSGSLSLPDNFPAELSARLSAAELNALNLAWENEQEILILEFSFDKEGFAARYKELREKLDSAAQVIAVSPNKTAFRFIAACDEAGKMINILREFKGRVLFQKRKRNGEENSKSEFASNENESELSWAVLHGEIAADISGKNIKFLLSGNDVKIPASLSKAASTILLHLVRNAVYHGIEFPLERAAFQKPAPGTVEITARIEDGRLLLTVCDDGNGSENTDGIFAAGYTTAPFVTEFSGRGIGLDAVSDAVAQAGGTIETKSKPGRGMSFEVRLPLKGK